MIDLIALLEEGLRAKPPRGDEHLPHMSDNICDRQTWARRRGEEMLPRDFRTLVKFELGHQFERGIGDALEAKLRAQGYGVLRDLDCSTSSGFTGHADFVAAKPTDSFVLEIKSTSFLRGQVPTTASPWYVEQAAMYTYALNMTRFGILVGCRESGKIAPVFWFNLDEQRYDEPETWREWTLERAKQIVKVTDPQAPMPAAEPRTAWACKTCSWAGCEKNPAYVDPSTLKKLEESYARNA
jgi:hypothetical protein